MSDAFGQAPYEDWRPPFPFERRPAQAEKPPRRFSWLAVGLALLAWCVILVLVVARVLGYPEHEEIPAETEAERESISILTMRAQARYMLEMQRLPMFAAGADREIYRQAKSQLNKGTVGQRLRFVIFGGEMEGPAEALDLLQTLQEQIDEKKPPVTTDQETLMDILRRLYGDYRRLRYDAPTVNEDERKLLQERLGWFGKLALAPAGQPGVKLQLAATAGAAAAAASQIEDACPDAQLRQEVLQPAKRVLVTVLSAFAGGVGFMLMGLIGILLFVILLAMGMLRGGLTCGVSPAGVYAETFALWMALLSGMGLVFELLPAGPMRLLLTGPVELCTLGVLVWPVLRGVPWRQVREDVGLTLGRAPAAEPALGLGCYIMNFPLMAVGMLGMLFLLLLQQALQHLLGGGVPVDDFASPSGPTHPIVAPLARGDWNVRLQLFFLASIVAPIVEEIMFRGVLYRHLREFSDRWSTAFSIAFSGLLSSFIFAVIHPQGIVAVPVLMALALGFVVAREWRGTLIPAMVAHGLNNGLVLLLSIAMMSD